MLTGHIDCIVVIYAYLLKTFYVGSSVILFDGMCFN